MVTAAMKVKNVCFFFEEKLWQTGQCLKKQRHYLPTMVHLVKAMVFPLDIYGCESWTLNKAED